MMKRLAVVVMVVVPALIASCRGVACDCGGPILGLQILTAAPITRVVLSGAACEGGAFRCLPADFDSTIHPDCTNLQINPKAVGECIVELTAGGTDTRIEHRMREYPNCCDEPGTFLGDEDQVGLVDLRTPIDAGVATDAAVAVAVAVD
jgi:hypothetical protein